MIPTDGASAEQRARYTAYAEGRLPRTREPQGPARLMFAPDLVGTSEEIAERLHAHAAFREVDEVAFALPFTFEQADYVQILTDMATRLGPALGWSPELAARSAPASSCRAASRRRTRTGPRRSGPTTTP